MTVAHSRGIAAIPEPEGAIQTAHAEIDAALDVLAESKDRWLQVSIEERIALCGQMIQDTLRVAERWVAAGCQAKSIRPGTPQVAEEWLAGPWSVLRGLRLLRASLEDIRTFGKPRIPGGVRTRPDGRVVARVVPVDTWDRVFYQGFTADIWMQPGVTEQNLADTMAVIYQGQPQSAKIALVLGAGNVSSIGPLDALYKLFVENQVVICKTNPVNAYLGPYWEESFAALVEGGYFRVVHGGAAEGAYLCEHDAIEEIHITGSDKTHDVIVFGPGPEGAERKARKEPKNTKRVTSELGNVSPVIVVPGPWGPKDLAFHGANLASMLTNNGAFNCNATRVIVTHGGWDQREALLDEVRGVFRQTPPRTAYYPGAADRHAAFVDAHPEAERIGDGGGDKLPWTLIPGVDPDNADDICFTTEAFCSVFAETALDAESPAEFLDKAVEFANGTLWGTLNAAILVHPRSMKDPAVAEAVERAVTNLRYGTITINHWPALGYGLQITPWGAYPGHPVDDIQSGAGVVHNTLMFEKPEKTVIRGPFQVKPTPPWFVTNKNSHVLAPKLAAFEADPSVLKVPGILMAALKG